ncbi:MAG: hypothetical protein HXY25_11295 [Alphaproteobacteria bacterium]|nr:hypothetical protein [Alphaproteobacteria bacterium]
MVVMADREAPEGRDWLALLGRGLSGVLLLVAGGLGLAATGHVDALPPHPLQGALSLHLALTSIGLSLGLVLRRRIGWTRRRPGPRALLLSGLAYLGLAATLTLAGLNLALGCLAPIGEPAGPLSLALLAVPGLVGLRLAADLLPAASVFSDAGVASGATPIADLIPFAATAARARPLARLSDALHTGLATLLFVGAVVVCVVSGIVYGLHLRDAFVVGEITYGPDLLAQIHAALGRLMASPPGMFTLGAAPALVALIEAGPFFRDCARLWRAPAYNRPLGPDELARLAAAHRALADHLARTPAVGGPGNAVLVRFVPLLALVLPSGVLIAAVTGGLTQGFLARVAAAGRVPDTGWRWYLDPLGAGDILLVAALTFAVMSLPALIGLVRPAFGRRLALQALLARASAPDLSEAIAEALAVELRLGRLGAFRTDDARLYLRRRSIEIGLRQGLALLALALLAAGLFALDRRAYDLFT